MSTKLYHAEVFIPAVLRSKASNVLFSKLEWSRHAQTELIRDKYGMIPLGEVPVDFFSPEWTLVELETQQTPNQTPLMPGGRFSKSALRAQEALSQERITKYVFRRPVDETRSLVIVLRPTCCGKATVVTCWTNLNSDKHNTLDRTKYEQHS